MPKLKTNSSAKKRFKLTASGKVRGTTAGKNHYRRNKTQRMIRNSRGTQIMQPMDAKMIIQMMPYA